MASLRFLIQLMTFAVLMLAVHTVQASNLRDGGDNSFAIHEAGSASDSAGHNSDTAKQGSATSDARSEAIASESDQDAGIIETESGVEDPAAGVRAWAQCGGLYYLGETQCAQQTFCKKISDFISVCFPESRPTEKVMRLEL